MVIFYQKQIAEGRGIAVFAVILSMFMRGWMFFELPTDTVRYTESEGFLWKLLMENIYFSPFGEAVISYLIAIALSLTVAYIGWHYSLIREKTSLPFALTLIILSTHPSYMVLSPALLASLLFFISISLFFLLYQHPTPQWKLFKIGIIVGTTSLIFVGILPYIFILVVGLFYFRLFNIRSILAIGLGFLFIYWTTMLLCYPMGLLADFLESAQGLNKTHALPLTEFTLTEWIILGVFIFMYIISFIHYRVSSHRDKLKIRSQINFLYFASVLSFLTYILLSWDIRFSLFVTWGFFMIPLSHFFALSPNKPKVILFYMLLAVCISLCAGQIYLFKYESIV